MKANDPRASNSLNQRKLSEKKQQAVRISFPPPPTKCSENP